MRLRGLRRRRPLLRIDNPDDADLQPSSSVSDDDTLVAIDSPDDVDVYLTGETGPYPADDGEPWRD